MYLIWNNFLELEYIVYNKLLVYNFFSWVDPLFWFGFRKELEQKDLYAVPGEARSQELLKCFSRYIAEIL